MQSMQLIFINHLQMQDHHALPFGYSFAAQLAYRYDKNGVLTHAVIVQKFKRIKPASLTASSSCTYYSLWKHEMSRWMKRLATTNVIHALHHEMILIISFKMATLLNRGGWQACRQLRIRFWTIKQLVV